MTQINKMPDDQLLSTFMEMFSEYRNTVGPYKKRKKFKLVCIEIVKRRLLNLAHIQ